MRTRNDVLAVLKDRLKELIDELEQANDEATKEIIMIRISEITSIIKAVL